MALISRDVSAKQAGVYLTLCMTLVGCGGPDEANNSNPPQSRWPGVYRGIAHSVFDCGLGPSEGGTWEVTWTVSGTGSTASASIDSEFIYPTVCGPISVSTSGAAASVIPKVCRSMLLDDGASMFTRLNSGSLTVGIEALSGSLRLTNTFSDSQGGGCADTITLNNLVRL